MTRLPEIELRKFVNSLSPKALSNKPEDKALYVAELHKTDEDPISTLATTIKWNINRAGAYLFTGMPGTGKTTELFRLKEKLESDGHRVFLIDGLEFISPTTEVEISDFLIAILLGFAEQLETRFQYKLFEETYAERFKNFILSEVQLIPELGAGGKISDVDCKATLKVTLTKNITLKKKLQQQLQSSLAKLFDLIDELITHAVEYLREHHVEASDGKVVILLDSLEKMHGDGIDSGTQKDPVLASLKHMVSHYSEQLFISGLHIVYAVPPYLLKLSPTLGNQVDAVCHLTTGHILQKRSRNTDPTGMSVFRTILTRRYPGWTKLLNATQIDKLCLYAGGDLREFFRLIYRVVVSANRPDVPHPVPDKLIDDAIQAQRRDYLPLPEDAKARLAHALQHFQPATATEADLDLVMRDLYLRRLLMYRNGEDWYMPHPLLWDELAKQP